MTRVDRLKQAVLRTEGRFAERRLRWAESYQASSGQPTVVRQALALRHLLTTVTVEIGPDELIVGRHPKRALSPAEQRRLQGLSALSEHEAQAHAFATAFTNEERVGLENAAYTAGPMTGHMTPDYDLVLTTGLARLKQQAAAQLAGEGADGPEADACRQFYRAAAIALDGALTFTRRYADRAAAMAEDEDDPRRAEELRAIAAACRRAPAQPPRSFHEALQAAWFVHLLLGMENGEGHGCFCPGRLDQYCWPFLRQDLDKAVLTRDQAQELLECYFIKLNEFDPWGVPQVLIVGGQHSDGSDASNPLTYMCLDACAHLGLLHPSLALSYHSGTPDALLRRACEVIGLGNGMPAIFNDDVIVPGLMLAGAPRSEAVNYVPGSCVEVSVIGRSNPWVASGYSNLAKQLLLALNDGADPASGVQIAPCTGPPEQMTSFDDLLAALKRQIGHFARLNTQSINRYESMMAEYWPFPLLSCLVHDCLPDGVEINRGGARYNLTEPEAVGLANVADALVSLKHTVFEAGGGRCTLAQVRDALAQDFVGHQELRRRLAQKGPRFGNDDDEVDALACELAQHWYDQVRQYRNTRGGRYWPGFLCWEMHWRLGEQTGATPDGRRAGQPLADCMGPAQGRDRHGPTAALNSVTKLDFVPALGGMATNLKFDRRLFAGPDGPEKLMALLRAFFAKGGFQAQINVLSQETLLAARERPEDYANLIVRVAGYSAYFTRLSEKLQDDIIARTLQPI
ncbi:MAG: pyruvate formate lyase family protein [Armatimonadota bacterium]